MDKMTMIEAELVWEPRVHFPKDVAEAESLMAEIQNKEDIAYQKFLDDLDREIRVEEDVSVLGVGTIFIGNCAKGQNNRMSAIGDCMTCPELSRCPEHKRF